MSGTTGALPSNTRQIMGISTLMGFGRGLLGFPLEQPLEALKTQWQAKPSFRNELHLARTVYANKGFSQGFYAGSLPNLGRILIKNSYRFPLIIGAPVYFEANLPEKMTKSKHMVKLSSGIAIAFVESFIICPFERMRTYFMTVERKDGRASF